MNEPSVSAERARKDRIRNGVVAVVAVVVVGGFIAFLEVSRGDEERPPTGVVGWSELRFEDPEEFTRLKDEGEIPAGVLKKLAWVDRSEAQYGSEDEKALRKMEREGEEGKAEMGQRLAGMTITDGTWKAGLDFEPGTYRALGGDGCYYALLGSANSQDVIDNGFAELNPTVAITSPWFETQDCGLWERIE